MKCNRGVKCNVLDCKYNQNNCECAREIIEVSMGKELPKNEKPLSSPHFCKTYEKKEEC